MGAPDRSMMQNTADQSFTMSPAADSGNSTQGLPESLAFRQLFTYASASDMVLIVFGTVGGLLAGAPLPVSAYLFGRVLDEAHFGNTDFRVQERRMSETAFHCLITGLIAAAAYFLQVACWMYVGERQAERIRYLYLQALLRQDLSFYDQRITTGAILESITVDTFHVKQATGEKVGKLVQIFGTLLCGYIIAFIEGWQLTLITTSVIPFLLLSGYAMNSIVSKVSRGVFAANGKAGCVIEQVTAAIKTVMPFGGEEKAVHAYDKALKVAAKSGLQQSIATGTGMGLICFLTFGMYAFTLWFGAYFIAHGTYSGGRVMTVLFSLIIATGALGQCMPSLTAITAGTAAAQKMFQIINHVPEVDIADESGLVLDGLRGRIELQGVYFAYPTRPEYQVFKDFSLLVPEGATAALVGESGSGKSTVVSLIERFYDPQSGQVKIDGVDLKGLRLSWFRRQVGLVAQEPVLLHGSVRENIAYGKEHASEKEIVAAAELANALGFIKSLPQGMETMVGQGGVQLSGGQKQRIAIARAVLKNPCILLLDEATSSLDAESEALVHMALEGLMQGRTTLIIAHRLSTIKDADFIAVLQQGRVVERGTHAELLDKTEGVFAELVRLEERRIAEEEHQLHQAQQISQSLSSQSFTCLNEKGSENPLSGTTGRQESFRRESKIALNIQTSEIPFPNSSIASFVGCSRVLHLASFNKPEFPLLLLGSLAACCNGATLPIIGLLFSKVIESFFRAPSAVRSSAMIWIYVFIGLAVLGLFLIPLQIACFSLAGERLVRRIRVLAFDKILHQHIKWFEQSENASGLISSQLQQDASQMRVVVGDGLSTIVQNLTTVFVGLFIAISACWQLALLFIALLPFYSLDACMQMKLGEAFDAKAKSSYAEVSQIAHDALSNIRTVASFCGEKKILSMYRAKSLECLTAGRRQALFGGLGFGATYIMMFGSLALSFWAGGKLIYSGQVDFDKFLKTFFTVELSACAVAISLGVAPDISNVKLAMASVFKLLDLKCNDLNAGMKLTKLKGEIKFQQVWFTYPLRPEARIFTNLSFALEAGKTLALVGQSGCGKSTVLAMVQRFYDPDQGTIFLDKTDIRQFQVKWLRRQMGLVSQEPFLFNDTIRANIEYGVEGEVTEEALAKAAEIANAAKFIAGLPKGYESVVGERGVQLSGGQKQRVAIARAMVRDPKIVLLDEATSALDAEAEVLVQEALERAAAGRSTMVVAHRLSTVRNANRILVLRDGCVAEEGTHEQLMATEGGIYASLVKISTGGTVSN